MTAGHDDLLRAAEALAARVPQPLAVLARLAYNYRWSWTPDGPDLFAAVDPVRWERCGENPVRLLQETGLESLACAAAGDADAARARRRGRGARARRPRAPRRGRAGDARAPDRLLLRRVRLARLAARSTPAASARWPATSSRRPPTARWPLVAVGLLYRQGYFRQRIDAGGWQHEYWVDTDPGAPARRARHAAPTARRSRSPCRSADVEVVGADLARRRRPRAAVPARRRAPGERTSRRWITVAALHRRPGHAPRAVHAARRRRRARARGAGHRARHRAPQRGPRGVRRRSSSRARARRHGSATAPGGRRGPSTIFTTHTPVPAGNDTYPAAPGRRGARRADRGSMGVDAEEIIRLGRTHPDDDGEPFGVTQFALRTSRAANGVSRRHGEVAREHVARLWPDARRRRRPDQPRHQRRARPDVARRADARAARPPPRRGLAGPRRRPRDVGAASTTSPPRSCGPSAPSSAPRSSTTSASTSVADRLGARRAARATSRPRPARSIPTC